MKIKICSSATGRCVLAENLTSHIISHNTSANTFSGTDFKIT